MRTQVLLLAGCLAGCSFMSRSAPLDVRYFSPEPAATGATARAAAPGPAPGAPPAAALQLGQLTSSTNLRDRIVYRRSPVEIGVYQTLRWTEDPEAYVRRSLSRALFQEHPIEQAMGGRAPALDVQVLAFELRHAQGAWSGRVQLWYRLRDERAVLRTGVVTVEQPAAGRGLDGAVTAVGVAMDAATAKVASEVAARLAPPAERVAATR